MELLTALTITSNKTFKLFLHILYYTITMLYYLLYYYTTRYDNTSTYRTIGTYSAQLSYLGCYRHPPYKNGTTEYMNYKYRGYDPYSCSTRCGKLDLNFVYVGEGGSSCACSESPPFDKDRRDLGACDSQCQYETRLTCGAQEYQRYSVYQSEGSFTQHACHFGSLIMLLYSTVGGATPDQVESKKWEKLKGHLRDLRGEKDTLVRKQEELANVKKEIDDLT